MHITTPRLIATIAGIATINAGTSAAILHLHAPPPMGAVIAIVVLASIATVGIVVDVIIASNNARQTAAIQENSRQQLLPIGATMIEAHRTIIEVDSHTEKIAKSQQVIQEATRSLVAAQPDKPINNDPSTTGPQRLTIAK